jgi:hypothetical protein
LNTRKHTNIKRQRNIIQYYRNGKHRTNKQTNKQTTNKQCLDEVSIPQKLRDEVYSVLTDAKIAQLKSGGNFPFLSRSDEVNLYIEVKELKGK